MMRISAAASLGIATAVATVLISASGAGASPSRHLLAAASMGSARVHLSAALTRFTVTPPNYPFTQHLTAQRMPPVTAGLRPEPAGSLKTCDYLSDYVSQTTNVYNGSSHAYAGTLTTSDGYGWGVATSNTIAYLGTWSDTINRLKPCKSAAAGVPLTGAAGLGYPLGIAAANNGSGLVYANEYPAGKVDEWVGVTHIGTYSDDPNCGAPGSYFMDTDTVGNVYLTCFDSTGANEIVDFCNPPPFSLATCTTIATLPGGFPGGVQVNGAGYAGHLVVADGYGKLYKYACTGENLIPAPTCTIVSPGAWTYTSSIPPTMEYTALALPKNGGAVLAANDYLCSSSNGLCGDGQDQKIAPWSSVAFDWNTTPAWSNAAPYGVAISPPDGV
jgi:hypothetical protein